MNVQVGIIGLGKIGHQFGVSAQGDPLSHSAAYSKISGVSLALGIDPSKKACQDYQNQFPEARVYESARDVPSETKLDVVSICSSTHTHTEGIQAALAWSPRVILCEKPLAPTVRESEYLVKACAERKCALMVNYSRRWTEMFHMLKLVIGEGGDLGPPVGACLRYSSGLVHNGTHWIDLLLALFGFPYSAKRIETPCDDTPDPSESIELFWQNGFTACLIAVRGTAYSIGEGEIWGTNGIVRYADLGQKVSFQSIEQSPWKGFRQLGAPRMLCEQGLKGHILCAVQEAVQLSQKPGKPTCSGEDGLLALSVVEMVRGTQNPRRLSQ